MEPDSLPPADPALSPFTGWTRAHWLAVADRLLDGAQRHASPGRARITPPGRPSWSGPDSDGLEGFARTFLLLALRVAGEGGADPAGLLERYADGLTHGTDPAHPEAWPRIDESCKQTVPEAASLAIGLHLTRPWLWDRLPEDTRTRVVAWMDGVFGLELPDNNWHLFRVVVAAFLESVGGPRSVADAAADVARIEELHVGDGWFRDGAGDRFDHYCGWAMHVYPFLVERITGREDVFPLAGERLHRFLEDFPLLVGADGAPMHQGRSLIYRMAAVAAPWTGALADATPLSPGLTRRLASGVLQHFWERGFLGADGVPTLGWYDAFPPMVQPYSAPASPFWLAKAFLGLLLPADHPVWTAVEEPLPVERADEVRALRAPGWVLSATRRDGVVRLLNHGSDNQPPLEGIEDPHYSRLAYSTATGPLLSDAPEAPLDNHVGLLDTTGRVTRRTRIHRVGVEGRFAASWHEPVWPDGEPSGARIETLAVALGPWELRLHRVLGAPRGLRLQETGWQVAAERAPEVRRRDGVATVSAGRLTSVLVRLAGHDGEPGAVRTGGTSAFGPLSATPTVVSFLAGSEHIAVTLVGLAADGLDVPSVTCRVADGVASVPMDGASVVVRLEPEARPAWARELLPDDARAVVVLADGTREVFSPAG